MGTRVCSEQSTDERGARALVTVTERLRRKLAVESEIAAIAEILEGAAVELGFDYVAFAEHGNPVDAGRGLLLMTNYPLTWQQRFFDERLDHVDPVQAACRLSAVGFCWSSLGSLMSLTARQEALLQDSRRFGLGDGFTVPLHLPGMRATSCSFAVRDGAPLPLRALWAAELVARTVHERVRRLAFQADTGPDLSPRQRDCVRLLATGLTDRGIARVLSLSEETVTKYLNAARRRYGVARRSQLVAAALRDGIIGYEDLVQN